MSRSASIFICQNCGSETRQFFGRCNNCNAWNTIVEEKIYKNQGNFKRTSFTSKLKKDSIISQPINELAEENHTRICTGYPEINRVLGGGLVSGSIILIGGEPGIGKSTLLLQSAGKMSKKNSILYITAEESPQQVKLRWDRLDENLNSINLLSETDLDVICNEIINFSPKVAIIDSIQAINDPNLSSSPGSVSQVKECSARLQHISKKNNISLLIVGHVTKDGTIAGPKVLEHLVDAVLTFEGDRFASYRLLRATKNRFGSTSELGIFEMDGDGLKEINNPSDLFLSDDQVAGVATIISSEGSRAIAIDIQSLVNTTSYASPRRTATGIEINRLHQILAVIEKKLKLTLSRYDCYLAVAGGIDIDDTSADLGIAAAIISSHKNINFPKGTIFLGEIGLGGQLRQVKQINQKIKEAEKLGFKRVIIPKVNLDKDNFKSSLEIIGCENLLEAISQARG